MKNKQWMLRAVGVISALALGLGGLAACGNSSSAESKNGRVYYLNKKKLKTQQNQSIRHL